MRTIVRLLVGGPLPTDAAGEERLSQPRAMGAFGIDALSSVAYGPDEILYVLILAGSAGVAWDTPIAAAIAGLLALVVLSYRQTIHAYPHGGGSFTVARENLGTRPGLVAAASLMVDYVLTVAVSVSAGVQALGAFVPAVNDHKVTACVVVIALLVIINLRGVREAGAWFVLPAYLFIVSVGVLLIIALVHVLGPNDLHLDKVPPPVSEDLTIFLILRAFASGCAGLTGVEAVANGVPMFRKPESVNAARTLTILGTVLALLLVGTTYVGNHIQAVPDANHNLIAQIGMAVDIDWLFYVVQVAMALTLLLAANTPFNGFPMLTAVMAREEYFPHQFAHLGHRLAYSNGIVVVGATSALLLIAFGGSTHAMIPLYAVGVFLCFTLSQAGMVRHWQRERTKGWRRKLTINGTGAVVTGLVTVIVTGEKFLEGAWLVVFVVPALAWLFARIRKHYDTARTELSIASPLRRVTAGSVLVPVNRLDRSAIAALEYAMALGNNVSAVHIATDEDKADQLRRRWDADGITIPLHIVPSPFREVNGPLIQHLEELREQDSRHQVTLVVPEVIPHRWWHEPLHNQTGLALELALRYHPGVVVTTVPVRLER